MLVIMNGPGVRLCLCCIIELLLTMHVTDYNLVMPKSPYIPGVHSCTYCSQPTITG